MIEMLSRFDLAEGHNLTETEKSYQAFAKEVSARGLLHSAGKIGRRVQNTPMDTDAADAPKYYAIMRFRDRAQMDAAYAFLAEPHESSAFDAFHQALKSTTVNQVFTCWEIPDEEA